MFNDDYVRTRVLTPPKSKVNPCKDVSVEKSSLPIEIAIQPKPEAKCKFMNDGIFYKINTTDFRIDEFLKNIPIMGEPPKEDGIYTWILAKTEKVEEFFACCRVLSMFEIGTVHQIIVLRTGATHIIAAGELKVEKGKLSYNFMSGTYMVPLMEIRQKKEEGKCNDEEFDKHLIQKMEKYFPGGLYLGNDKTLINSGPLKDGVELALYVKYCAKLEKCLMGASRRRHRKKRNTVRTKRSKRK